MASPFLLGLLTLCLHVQAIPTRTACAADYSSCGSSLPSPIGNLPCCNSTFYCYTHGPYFSQCRPIHETEVRRARETLCGRPYGVCSAGSSADTRLKCCDPEYVCVPASPLFWQCVPNKSRWYEVQVAGTKKLWFMDGDTAARENARVLAAAEKVVGEVGEHTRALRVFVPVMSRVESDDFESDLREIDGVGRVDRGVGVVFVDVGSHLKESVGKIAKMRQVARVEIV